MLLEMINDPEKKDPTDKLRLFLIYYLTITEEIPKDDMADYEKALEAAGCQLEALNYIKK
jgi:sec1 family domain-containing protein 1